MAKEDSLRQRITLSVPEVIAQEDGLRQYQRLRRRIGDVTELYQLAAVMLAELPLGLDLKQYKTQCHPVQKLSTVQYKNTVLLGEAGALKNPGLLRRRRTPY
eukprot:1718291-Rhodomonas_salina.1